jgi:hypothetical protein
MNARFALTSALVAVAIIGLSGMASAAETKDPILKCPNGLDSEVCSPPPIPPLEEMSVTGSDSDVVVDESEFDTDSQGPTFACSASRGSLSPASGLPALALLGAGYGVMRRRLHRCQHRAS